MPIYRGATRVTPKRAGVDLARVYRGDSLVWEAVITVTPQAPTFHNAAPWVTLPAQQGVEYSVSGTPGYSQSVTVTASPLPGYRLVGTSSWSHTYGPPPRYVASDSGGAISRLSRDTWRTVHTHTVARDGAASGQWRVNWRDGYFQANTDVRVLRNGSTIASNSSAAETGWQSVSIPETDLHDGDSLTFQAQWRGISTAAGRYVDAWSWSLS